MSFSHCYFWMMFKKLVYFRSTNQKTSPHWAEEKRRKRERMMKLLSLQENWRRNMWATLWRFVSIELPFENVATIFCIFSPQGEKPKKKQDRIQDLIDIGYGYDEEDSFIDNTEAVSVKMCVWTSTELWGGCISNTQWNIISLLNGL